MKCLKRSQPEKTIYKFSKQYTKLPELFSPLFVNSGHISYHQQILDSAVSDELGLWVMLGFDKVVFK